MGNVYVLLSDNESALLVACPNTEAAASLGLAALHGGGDVSAWRVPEIAIVEWEKVRNELRKNSDCGDLGDKLDEGGFTVAPREPGLT